MTHGMRGYREPQRALPRHDGTKGREHPALAALIREAGGALGAPRSAEVLFDPAERRAYEHREQRVRRWTLMLALGALPGFLIGFVGGAFLAGLADAREAAPLVATGLALVLSIGAADALRRLHLGRADPPRVTVVFEEGVADRVIQPALGPQPSRHVRFDAVARVERETWPIRGRNGQVKGWRFELKLLDADGAVCFDVTGPAPVHLDRDLPPPRAWVLSNVLESAVKKNAAKRRPDPSRHEGRHR